MPNKPEGMAAVEAAYFRRLYGDAEADLTPVKLVYPGKDLTGRIKVTEVKPVPIRQTNQRMRSELEKDSPGVD
jgi:hypothetical protein